MASAGSPVSEAAAVILWVVGVVDANALQHCYNKKLGKGIERYVL